jgi:hypothetical protein
MPHPSQPAAAKPAGRPPHPTADPPTAKNPRGNLTLHLAPSQPPRGLDPRGARPRPGCPCRAPEIHAKRRRLHGGRSTGPRTPKNLPRRRPGASTTYAPPAPSTSTMARGRAPKSATVSPCCAAPASTSPRCATGTTCRPPSPPASIATRRC